jgi:cell division protease FtsH
MQQNQNDNKNNNNNFFNQNPLITFVIFAIVTILAFKAIAPQNSSTNQMNNANAFSKQLNVPYSELKKMIVEGNIKYVGIGQHIIKAQTKDGAYLVTKRLNNDLTLIPLLDKYNVPYDSIQDTSWFNELLFGWVIPVFIFFALDVSC